MEQTLKLDKPTVVVDTREPIEADNFFRKEDINLLRLQLAFADYILPGGVAVERKTLEDFESSIYDGRLLRQMSELKENFQKRILIIEGVVAPERLAAEIKEGALIRIALMGTSILYSKNFDETLKLIKKMTLKLWEGGEKNYSLMRGRKPKNTRDRVLYILSSMPNISEKKARHLLKHFKSLHKLANADIKEIMKVEGIGKKIAEDIKKICNYTEECE